MAYLGVALLGGFIVGGLVRLFGQLPGLFLLCLGSGLGLSVRVCRLLLLHDVDDVF
jgi:uncharacterized membrane protein YccC